MTRKGSLVASGVLVVLLGGLLASLALRGIRRTLPVSVPAVPNARVTDSPLPTRQQEAKVLKVTDTKGKVVTLEFDKAPAEVDYTSYPEFGLYTPDFYSGLRISQGEGMIATSWDTLARVDLTKYTRDGAEAQIITVSGDKQSVVLLPWSKHGLSGNTQIGRFSIGMNKVKTIEVIR
jgi:hypothetical protein